MKAIFAILLMLVSQLLFSQTILNSPSDAKKVKEIDYANIRWTSYQEPHYRVDGFDRDFLEMNLFTLEDFEEAGEVLLEKINRYRKEMGKGRLELDETASHVALEYAARLAKRGKLTHTLKGKTPSDRIRPYYKGKASATENLVRFGSTMAFKSVDDLTDMFLHSWINSKGHNTNLLNEGEYAGIGVFTHINKKQDYQETVGVFMIIYRW
jgi:uncharacterized protein YkwD